MRSSTEQIRCLIVEDDRFKLDSVRAHLRRALDQKVVITACHALSTATSLLSAARFDLVIIDMSIHSHEPEVGAGSPLPLPSGGLDVLFEVSHSSHGSACVILTQYTDVLIEGVPIPVHSAAEEIELKFGIKVSGCIQYSESDSRWKAELDHVLDSV